MTRVVLSIEPNDDAPTMASYAYRSAVVPPYFETKGFRVILCHGTDAVRSKVQPDAALSATMYIAAGGHGRAEAYLGHRKTEVFEVGAYTDPEANGKIVHLMSCSTAQLLGPDFVCHGCRAFFGYDVPFVVKISHKDIFYECDAEIDLAFADGLTADEVYVRVITLYDRRIGQLIAWGYPRAAAALQSHRDHLCAPIIDPKWGDGSARL